MLLLVVGACGDTTSSAEREMCETFHDFEASRQADEIQVLRGQLREQSQQVDNGELRAAAAEFEEELAAGDVNRAGDAVGRIRTECERLGIRR
jgi:hypothetical protein